MTEPDNPYAELRALFERALRAPDPLEALLRLFDSINDQWDSIDVSTFGQGPESSIMWNRSLVARIRRGGMIRQPDRSVGADG